MVTIHLFHLRQDAIRGYPVGAVRADRRKKTEASLAPGQLAAPMRLDCAPLSYAFSDLGKAETPESAIRQTRRLPFAKGTDSATAERK
jgi:hypothetical protein